LKRYADAFRRGAGPSAFFLCLLLLSCAGVPSYVPPAEDGAAILPAGGELYILADLEGSGGVEDFLPPELRKDKNAERLLRRTRGAAVVFFPESPEPSGPRFFALAWGRYPRFAVNLGLAFNRSWKKTASVTGKRYWRFRTAPGGGDPAGLSLVPGSELVLLSDGDPFSFSPGAAGPGTFMDFRRGSVLSGWLPGPALRINRFLEALEIPLMIPAEELFFSLIPLAPETPGLPEAPPGEGPPARFYELSFRVKTPSVSQARALVSLFSMARFFIPFPEPSGAPAWKPGDPGEPDPEEALAALAPLFASLPSQEGVYLTIRSGPMASGEIALLFGIFSLYSIQNTK
jgi:hypothetical protein